MPQQFQVLRCYKCSVFQGHQTTKSNKWECKLCGEKQSFKRFYGIGTAKECRFQVQKLNSLRGQIDEAKNNTDQDINISKSEEIVKMPVRNNYTPVENSKWSNYDETEIVEENNLEDMHLGETKVVLEIPMKRRKQSTNNFKGNPVLISTNRKDHTTTPEIVPNSLIISRETKPNTSQSSFDIEDSLSGQELINKIINNKFNKFIPPPTNKNSKWAQFTDEPNEIEQTALSEPLENIDDLCTDSKLTPQNEKFSWSDDTDIESILSI